VGRERKASEFARKGYAIIVTVYRQ